jgi:hypothetical protein
MVSNAHDNKNFLLDCRNVTGDCGNFFSVSIIF